ncbi:transporter substrate-binding domain-containing protein [Chitinimonas arctica]|nr:transporter substrate-binding domain-containing protein [Chitinimonas arctica]
MNKQRRHLLRMLGSVPFLTAASRPERLLVSYNDDYAPYSYIDPQQGGGQVLGILPEILDPLLAEIPGILAGKQGLPWRRVQAMVQQGEADALCTFASAERKQYAVFNRVAVTTLVPHLFFSARHPRRAELEAIRSRDALKAFHLVDQKGNQWAEQALKDFPSVEWTPGHDAIFRMVMAERGDLHVSLSPLVTLWRLKKLGIHSQVVSIPAPYVAAEVPFHLGVRLSHPLATEIAEYLDKALLKPAVARRIEDILKRYGGQA